MSSHHFVKEGQEPALLILEPVAFEAAAPLLEWAPYVVVASDAVEAVMSWGVRVDCVVTAEGLLFSTEILDQQSVEVIEVKQPANISAFVSNFITNRGQNGLNILTQNADQIIGSIKADMKGFAITVIDSRNRWMLVDHFEKWVPEGYRAVIRQTHQDQLFEVRHLASRDASYLAEKDGIVSVSSDRIFWVGEDL